MGDDPKDSPIVQKIESCQVSARESETVDIDVEASFVVPAKEVKVLRKEGKETVLDFAPSYFLELKILPISYDAAWRAVIGQF